MLADFNSRLPLKKWMGLLDEAAFDLSAEIPPTRLELAAYDEWQKDWD